MRSSTLKWILLVCTLLITAIIAAQLFWLNKVYRYEEKEFSNNVIKSVRGLYEDMSLVRNPGTDLHDHIESPAPDAFLIRTDVLPLKDSVIYYLTTELENFDVFSDYYIASYSSASKNYLFTAYIPGSEPTREKNMQSTLNVYDRSHNYILLYFPHRQQYILQQLGFWIIAAVLLVLSLIGFAISLFYLYRQKTLNELQKDFVNNFTHEFKTPLAVLKIAADVLVTPSIREQPDRLKKYGSIVKKQTEHLQEQVNKLLITAATEEHTLPLTISRFVLNDMISEVLQELEPLISEKNVRIVFEPEDKNLLLTADASQLSMVVVNLIENGIKYSKEPYLIIKTEASNGHYVISVKDNGIGIEHEYLPFIFKKFYRIPTGDVHNVKGFGLGLNFVKKVVDAHDGKVTVNSLPGIGTEFRIILPNQ